jgi:hypothetical protein
MEKIAELFLMVVVGVFLTMLCLVALVTGEWKYIGRVLKGDF